MTFATEKEARAKMDEDISAAFREYLFGSARLWARYDENKRLAEMCFANWQRTGRYETGETL